MVGVKSRFLTGLGARFEMTSYKTAFLGKYAGVGAKASARVVRSNMVWLSCTGFGACGKLLSIAKW
jgi:hypothetical protein